jgi:hypothetical protein
LKRFLLAIAFVLGLSCVGHAQCTAGTNGLAVSTAGCGNTGDAYEGGGVPAATTFAACGFDFSAGGNFRLTGNIGSDASAACLNFNFPAASINLDLGGFTVTGAVNASSTNRSPNVVYNGTINCTLTSYCLQFNTYGRMHHLTVTNSSGSVSGSVAINIAGVEPLAAGYLGLRIDHVTATVASTPNAGRTQVIRDSGGNKGPAGRSISVEIDHDLLTCSDDASACQGAELFTADGSYVHNNLFNLPTTCPDCTDSARATIFDQMAPGEFAFNVVNTRANRAVRARSQAVYAGTIKVHDNAFKNILTAGREGAIVNGENDNNLNSIPMDVYNNSFELGPSGNGFVCSAAINCNGYNNTVTCVSGDCSVVGYFGVAQVPSTSYGTSGTILRLTNNTVSVLTAAGKPAALACASPPGNAAYDCAASAVATLTSTVQICNSGTAVGNGTIEAVSCLQLGTVPNLGMFAWLGSGSGRSLLRDAFAQLNEWVFYSVIEDRWRDYRS